MYHPIDETSKRLQRADLQVYTKLADNLDRCVCSGSQARVGTRENGKVSGESKRMTHLRLAAI